MTRREALYYALLAGSGALLAACGASPAETRTPLHALASMDLQPAMAYLGNVYLRDHPEERDEARLRRLLGLEHGSLDYLLASIEEDARHDRFASIDSWLVTQTEARLYAFAALAA